MRVPPKKPVTWAAVKAAESKVPNAAAAVPKPAATKAAPAAAIPSKATIAADLQAVAAMQAERKGVKPAVQAPPAGKHGSVPKAAKSIEKKVRAMRGNAKHHELGDGNVPSNAVEGAEAPGVSILAKQRAAHAKYVKDHDIKPYLPKHKSSVHTEAKKPARKAALKKTAAKTAAKTTEKKTVAKETTRKATSAAAKAAKKVIEAAAAANKKEAVVIKQSAPADPKVHKPKPVMKKAPMSPVQRARAAAIAADRKEAQMVKQEEDSVKKRAKQIKKMKVRQATFPSIAKVEREEAEASEKERHKPIAQVRADFEKASKAAKVHP